MTKKTYNPKTIPQTNLPHKHTYADLLKRDHILESEILEREKARRENQGTNVILRSFILKHNDLLNSSCLVGVVDEPLFVKQHQNVTIFKKFN